MFQKLKQFKDMRDQAKEIHTKLSGESCEGTAGFNKVKIVINGAQEILSVSIDPSLMMESERGKLEGYVRDAANDAMKKCHRLMAEKMKDGSFGDFKMPDLKG
ncbi:MAG: YbaB/EbfC family nucleoid-associated protein [Candidatus Magasanikbacteria bacterium]|nr:YbaB/EbfC family nucleoid-associated protein [Candidatus Magasanikbacteria bacterium]